MSTITVDDAEEILFDPATRIQDVSQHRWYVKQLVVYERDGELRGFYHLNPATELQEDMDVFEADPVPTFPVKAREVTTIVYEAAGS
jgi:hypothetical protein